MRQLAAGAAAAAGVPGCALEVRVSVVDGLHLDELVLVRVPEERAHVELQRDALVRADGAGGELHLHDGVRVLLALLDIYSSTSTGQGIEAMASITSITTAGATVLESNRSPATITASTF